VQSGRNTPTFVGTRRLRLHLKDKGSTFLQKNGKIYQNARRQDLHGGVVAADVVVMAVVVVIFPVGERYEMTTPFVLM
jgi:hypothetical protein